MSRKPEGRKVRGWMVERGITNAAVAKKCGVTPETVSQTIHGARHNYRVLRELQIMGCPDAIQDLPDWMRIES
ncbi:MAG: XRE family transcriptional regulator [Magnetococcales bacterium]|nr:XRE family transcriptional regulator [Magnetococcales bacterium]